MNNILREGRINVRIGSFSASPLRGRGSRGSQAGVTDNPIVRARGDEVARRPAVLRDRADSVAGAGLVRNREIGRTSLWGRSNPLEVVRA